MATMTEPIGLAEGRPFTVHDLEAMPDDGRHYELIDGMLLVTPAPGWSHQEMSAALYVLLREACPPVLAVEVLSRITQLNDRNTKKAHYERLGVPSYWLLNPVQPGGLEVHQLDEQGRYQLIAKMTGDEVFVAHHPFPVRICPARLLDGLRPR